MSKAGYESWCLTLSIIPKIYKYKNTHSHINVFQMIAFFTHARTYKNTSVSKPVRLEVNTLVPCTSQIRQFGRRKKHSFLLEKRALTSTWERENLFVCCDCICAQLNLRQNKYMCHIVRKGGRRQSWIEDKKGRRRGGSRVWLVVRIQDFLELKLSCIAFECCRAFRSVYPSKSTQMSSFSSNGEQHFFFGHFSICNLHLPHFQLRFKFSTSQAFKSSSTMSAFLKDTLTLFEGLQSLNCSSHPHVNSRFWGFNRSPSRHEP